MYEDLTMHSFPVLSLLLKMIGHARVGIPTHRKKRKGKQLKTKRERAARPIKKELAQLLKPASTTPSNTESARSFYRDIEMGRCKSCSISRFCSEGAHKNIDMQTKQHVSGYTWSYTENIILPQIDDSQCYIQTHLSIKKHAPLSKWSIVVLGMYR